MKSKFKVGDKVKRKSGYPFSNGKHIVTIDEWPKHEDASIQENGEVWLKETQTYVREESIELDHTTPWHNFIQPNAKVKVRDLYRSHSRDYTECTVVTSTDKSVVVEKNGLEFFVNKLDGEITPCDDKDALLNLLYKAHDESGAAVYASFMSPDDFDEYFTKMADWLIKNGGLNDVTTST